MTPPVTAIFFNNPAESWLNVQLPKPNVRIMYTGFVGDNVPPHLLYICNRMDQLCIMNEAENATWVISGINQELVRVVSGIHPWQFLPIVPVGKGVCYSSDQIFRFLSMGTFFPNCRWDVLIKAYLEEFRGNDQVELYLRVTIQAGIRYRENQNAI